MVFAFPWKLKRHLARKTPCDPIIDTQDAEQGKLLCRYCGRPFASTPALTRHVKHRCKIANSDEGMEKLMDHTLRKQLAEQNTKMDEQSKQIAELTAIVKQMAVGHVVPQEEKKEDTPPPNTVHNAPVTMNTTVNNTGPVTQNQINVTQKIVIQPWDGDQRIRVTAEMISEAFAENARLAEYCKMSDYEQTNPENAGPYVLEALLDLTKRAHKDPMTRNIYLNPKRADQVMVCLVDGSWEVRSLEEATRMMFDGVAMEIKRVVRSNEERGKLSYQVQGSASYVPMMYEDEQDRFVAMAKKPVSAHLTNTAPPKAVK